MGWQRKKREPAWNPIPIPTEEEVWGTRRKGHKKSEEGGEKEGEKSKGGDEAGGKSDGENTRLTLKRHFSRRTRTALLGRRGAKPGSKVVLPQRQQSDPLQAFKVRVCFVCVLCVLCFRDRKQCAFWLSISPQDQRVSSVSPQSASNNMHKTPTHHTTRTGDHQQTPRRSQQSITHWRRVSLHC